MATKAATKKAEVVVEEPVEDDEIEALDEVEETAEEAAPAKKTKKAKAKKEEPEGYTTKEVGEMLGIAPVKLRRILRTDDFTNDKEYTRYRLTDEDVERLKAAIAAGATKKTTAAPKKAKGKKTQDAAEEVSAELEELDDLAEDEEVADIDLTSDEGDDDVEEEDEEEDDDE